MAEAVIINSESLRTEIERHLEVDPGKLKLIHEAVDHDLFKPGDAGEARAQVAAYGVTKPFVLFVSSLWPYKNCDGLLRALAHARAALGDRQLVIVGPAAMRSTPPSLPALAAELGIAGDVVFVGGLPLAETVHVLPGRRCVRIPVVQRDLRAADPGGDGLRLPGRDVDTHRDAGNRGRRRGSCRSRPIRRPSPRPSSRRWPGRDRLRDQGLRAGGRVHLGRDGGIDPRRLPRGRRASGGKRKK